MAPIRSTKMLAFFILLVDAGCQLIIMLLQFVYLSDQHLYARRWEAMINNRSQFDIAQILTWNDYGESSYVGPIKGAQPNSQAWTNGMNHTGSCHTNTHSLVNAALMLDISLVGSYKVLRGCFQDRSIPRYREGPACHVVPSALNKCPSS